MFDRMFFARQDELRDIVDELQRDGPLYAVITGMSHTKARPTVLLSKLRRPDVPSTLNELNEPYLIQRTPTFVVDEIPQRRGGMLYDVNLKSNPNAWYLILGGELPPDVLIPGRIAGSLARNGESFRRSFERATRLYEMEGPFLVSQNARRFGLSGGRLVANSNPESPIEYDLQIIEKRPLQ